MVVARRGEIWWAELDPTMGREQAGRSPVVIVSADLFNAGPRELVFIIPLTRRIRGYSHHVTVSPETSGLDAACAMMCEQLRAVSIRRLVGQSPIGRIDDATLRAAMYRVTTILDVPA